MTRPRGSRNFQTKLKEAYWISKKKAAGTQQALIEAWKKKPWDMKVWELIKDKVNPVKLATTIAFTPLVKMAIDSSPDALNMYQILIGAGSPLAGFLFKKVIDPEDLREKLKQNDLYLWVVAFGLAYLCVENYDKIIEAGATVGGWVKGLFAV